jgi:hypothetical protein
VVVEFSVVDVDGGSDVVTLVAVGSSSLSLMVVGVVTWRCWWLKGCCWWLLVAVDVVVAIDGGDGDMAR